MPVERIKNFPYPNISSIEDVDRYLKNLHRCLSEDQYERAMDFNDIVFDSAIVNSLYIKNTGELRLYDNGNYVGFEPPALSADQIWVLPSADGPANEVLGTDNSGNLIWRTHDELASFVANEHIDHTGVSISGGGLISGGGDISANRTLTLTEATIESAIDTLANLTSIQGQTVSLSGSLTVESNSIINQDVSSDSTAVTFGDLELTSGHLALSSADALAQWTGTAGGSGGIQYKDQGGTVRYGLLWAGSDVVALCNRAANGTIELRANTSTAGSGGENTVVTIADDNVTFGQTFTGVTGSTIGNLTLANGSITDSGGSINFNDESLSTTGTLGSGAITSSSYIATTGSGVNGEFRFTADYDAGNRGITYKDSGGSQRLALLIPDGQDTVHILNRAANGTVEIHANTSTAGLGGNTTVVTVEDTDVTLADGIGFNLQEDITFSGATTENLIKIPDHLAVALDITEASNSYLKFVTTNGSESVTFGKTFSAITGSTIGTMTIADGSITDSTTAISFGDENLSTTGTLGCDDFTSSGFIKTNENTDGGGGYMSVGSASGDKHEPLFYGLSESTDFGLRLIAQPEGAGQVSYTQAGVAFETRRAGDITGLTSGIAFAFDNGYQHHSLVVDANDNVGISTSTFGTNATNTIGVETGVAPTTSPADAFQMYSADQSAGNACAHFRTENGGVIKIYQGSHIADAEASHTLTDASETCDRSEIEGFLDALGAKINAIYTAMENAGFLASS